MSVRKQIGFSMVEALVALVVLGVGMLGVAGLYVTTLRSSGSAISRMQAVNLASDLSDRIRANQTGGDNYIFDSSSASGTDNHCVNGTANCSPSAMAQNDLYVWKRQLQRTLPGSPKGVVTHVTGTPDTYTITVSWREPGDNADLSYTLRMQL